MTATDETEKLVALLEVARCPECCFKPSIPHCQWCIGRDALLTRLRSDGPDRVGLMPLQPTAEMKKDGARRLLSFQDGSTDESFDGLQWAASKNDAERVWRSMWLAAGGKE